MTIVKAMRAALTDLQRQAVELQTLLDTLSGDVPALVAARIVIDLSYSRRTLESACNQLTNAGPFAEETDSTGEENK
jgi:hypothetical protein